MKYVENMLQDKQGVVSHFETGNAEFDALSAKLGVQEVLLGGRRFLDAVILYSSIECLNLRVASEAYSHGGRGAACQSLRVILLSK